MTTDEQHSYSFVSDLDSNGSFLSSYQSSKAANAVFIDRQFCKLNNYLQKKKFEIKIIAIHLSGKRLRQKSERLRDQNSPLRNSSEFILCPKTYSCRDCIIAFPSRLPNFKKKTTSRHHVRG